MSSEDHLARFAHTFSDGTRDFTLTLWTTKPQYYGEGSTLVHFTVHGSDLLPIEIKSADELGSALRATRVDLVQAICATSIEPFVRFVTSGLGLPLCLPTLNLHERICGCDLPGLAPPHCQANGLIFWSWDSPHVQYIFNLSDGTMTQREYPDVKDPARE